MAEQTPAYVSSRYPTSEQRAALEQHVLADALYRTWERHGDAVTVTEPPLRGRVMLLSCYTPAWWYATCRSCPWISTSTEHYNDPALSAAADAHRCSPASTDAGEPRG